MNNITIKIHESSSVTNNNMKKDIWASNPFAKKYQAKLKEKELKRTPREQIDYYGDEANYIHLKFGDARKMYNFTPEFIEKYPLFAREYASYFERDNVSQFKNPFQIVAYVYKNKIPVYFYYNFCDEPATNEKLIMKSLVDENSYIGELK